MIEVKDLSFAYSKATPIFTSFNLVIETGERVGLVGKSGAGKSTLCKLLAHHLKPDRGTILLDGRPYAGGYNPIQLVLQHPEFAFDPNITLRKSLMEVYRDESEYLPRLERFMLKKEMLERFPHELSGGELQRIALMRVLRKETKYIVADELTAMMDSYTQALIWKVIDDYLNATGTGLIMVAHDQRLLDRMVTRKVVIG